MLSVWIRGPGLQIITSYLWLNFFFAVRLLGKKKTKKKRLEAFFLFLPFIFAVLFDVL